MTIITPRDTRGSRSAPTPVQTPRHASPLPGHPAHALRGNRACRERLHSYSRVAPARERFGDEAVVLSQRRSRRALFQTRCEPASSEGSTNNRPLYSAGIGGLHAARNRLPNSVTITHSRSDPSSPCCGRLSPPPMFADA